jgi:poly(hydroxyalkanoate) depolymerase family esterase
VSEHRNSRALSELTGFGANPGNLRSWLYLPSILTPKAPLVVVLHGCTQTAAGYDQGSGWTQLAEKNGFAVLFPEQQRANNANLCFNWFEPGDIKRDAGEALSIREMIDHVVLAHGLDRPRIFITGLSAGGAMANVMLATCPELFSGGALIGGLPYGMASSVDQAFQRMQGRNAPTSRQLRAALANASPASANWPKISVWHGTRDQTVRPVNATEIIDQWRGPHGATDTPANVESTGGYSRKTWVGADGKAALELYLITGMGHGVPLTAGGKAPLGKPGPYMLETGISSTARIARGWGLADDSDVADAEGPRTDHPSAANGGAETLVARAMAHARRRTGNAAADPAAGHAAGEGVGKVINDALRAAGLIR